MDVVVDYIRSSSEKVADLLVGESLRNKYGRSELARGKRLYQ